MNTDSGSQITLAYSWISQLTAAGPRLFTATEAALKSRNWQDTHARNIPCCALLHLRACLLASIQANAKGEHSVAACLLRQSLESLTLIEIGLLEESIGAPLAHGWHDATMTHGQLRRELQLRVWPRYGPGLWAEPWSQFFTNLAKAVQPYSHYSQQLMMWQFHAVTRPVLGEPQRDSFHFVACVGPMFEDTEKTLQISVIQALLLWALGRLILANARGTSQHIGSEVTALEKSIKESAFLVEKVSWADLLVPVIVGGV